MKLTLMATAFIGCLATAAHADLLYTFDNGATPSGTSNPEITESGVMADFNGAVIGNLYGFQSPISNNSLFAASGTSWVTFSALMNAASVDFSTAAPVNFTMEAFVGGPGGTLVDWVSMVGLVPLGGSFPQGLVSLQSSTSFDTLVFTSPGSENVIDNLDIPAAPEPSAILLLATCVGFAGLAARKRLPPVCRPR